MRKTLSELLRESYLEEQPQFRHPGQAVPVNPGGRPAPGAAGAQAPANPLQSRITITSEAGGTSFIIGYLPSSKGWCVYARDPGAPKARLWAGPLPTIAAAFAKLATGF